MEETLADGAPEPGTIVTAIARRQVFPVYFGAALRLDGVDALLEGLQRWTRQPRSGEEFGAHVVQHGAIVERLGYILYFDHCSMSLVRITSKKRIRMELATTPLVEALPTSRAPPFT